MKAGWPFPGRRPGEQGTSPGQAMGAIGLVLRQRSYRYLALALFVPALAVYVFTLPTVYTGGVIGLVALSYLDWELGLFSLALAALLSLTLALNVYAFRSSLRRRGGGLSVGAVVASLVPGSVCCTSLVPSLLAVLGASSPQIFGLTGKIQGFVATHETLFLAVALALLFVSLRLAAKGIAVSCPVSEGGAPGHGGFRRKALP